MPQHSTEVTFTDRRTARIPERLVESACIIADLQNRGQVSEAGLRVRVRRQGGYCGLDGWLMLLVYFASGVRSSVRGFWTTLLGPCVAEVAWLAGRKRLPSSAALSRLLARVENDLLRPVAGWLLAGLPEIDGVLQHPTTHSYDAQGQDWHVFDVDPTVTTLYRRRLPAGYDLPEPLRRSDGTGAPGYSGRKRGDLQYQRVTVQHAGSGAWTHAHLSPGNGKGVVDLELALASIVETGKRLEHPLERILVRGDGAYGNVPSMAAFRAAGLPFIVRLNRSALYDDPEILDRLRAAPRFRVPDSGCGPQRAAVDIGVVTMAPDRDTKRPDGSDYEPISVRVVASLFPQSGEAKRGRVIDGWQVELFAADLPADAWPAADVVATYFGRAAEENRFAQEDREMGLDRIFSFHLPGQELATLVGLSVWNLRIARGFELEPPPAERPVQQLRCAELDDRVPEHWPRDPVIQRLLDQLEWGSLLSRRPGWQWGADAHQLRCPDGRPLELTSVRPKEHAEGRTGIIFRRPWAGCEDCEPRQDCFQSWRHAASKHAEFSVPTKLAGKLRRRLARLRVEAEPNVVPIIDAPGPRHIHHSLFLPAEARRAFRECFDHAWARVELELPPPEPPRPRLLARDAAHRQRRRETWTQKRQRYALPPGATARLRLHGASRVQQLFEPSFGSRSTSQAAAS